MIFKKYVFLLHQWLEESPKRYLRQNYDKKTPTESKQYLICNHSTDNTFISDSDALWFYYSGKDTHFNNIFSFLTTIL